jgi:hypothetical protein
MASFGGNAQKKDPTNNDELFLKSNAQNETLEFTWDIENLQRVISSSLIAFPFGKSWRLDFESGKMVQQYSRSYKITITVF